MIFVALWLVAGRPHFFDILKFNARKLSCNIWLLMAFVHMREGMASFWLHHASREYGQERVNYLWQF